MAIVFDAEAHATAFNEDPSWTHTIAEGEGRIVVVGVGVRQDSDAGAPEIVEVSLDGSLFTLLETQTVGDTLHQWIYYLPSPPAGEGTVTVNGDWAAGNNIIGMSMSYTGVNTSSPFGTVASSASGASTSADITLTSEDTGVCIDLFAARGGATIAVTGGQTLRVSTNAGVGGAIIYSGMSDEAGAASVEMSWDASVSNVIGLIGAPLRPAIAGKARAVKYFHDIYDPGGRIFDDLGKVVPPWELKPNNWIKVTGLFLPSSKVYSSFVQDPTVAYIEEVTFSARGGLRIKTNRGEMTDVLLARASGGKTL
jgi:hypothetical protein